MRQPAADLDEVWRRESSHVLGALLRRHRRLEDCEDAAQEALAVAATQWPVEGRPNDPRAWLILVAHRRLIDRHRASTSRRRREVADAVADRRDHPADDAPSDDGVPRPRGSDLLDLMLRCCHPALSRPSQVALTLRCVAGLSTDAIAAAFLVPTTTMGQRLSRARATLRDDDATFERPGRAELEERLAAVLDVLHLVFNEGHTLTAGRELTGVALADEAIRLTRLLRLAVPDHAEVAGLLALELLTHARTSARVDADGDLVRLAEQDRALWDTALVAEGMQLLEETLRRGHVGRYQLEAAIAAVHAEAAAHEDTDWLQIVLLYDALRRIAPSPSVTLARAAAVAMALGPAEAVRIVEELRGEPRMDDDHRVHAVLGHLRELQARPSDAAVHYARAAALTRSVPEQRYLNRRLAGLRHVETAGPTDTA